MLPVFRPLGVRGGLACRQQLPALPASHDDTQEEEEDGSYICQPVNKTDHMCQDIKFPTRQQR